MECDIDGMADDYLRSLDGYGHPPSSIAFEFDRLRLVALLEDAWDVGYINGRMDVFKPLLAKPPANLNEAA